LDNNEDFGNVMHFHWWKHYLVGAPWKSMFQKRGNTWQT
jgi:hypothetical protein